MGEKQLMKGNEAFATAAINAGCRYYFGYPITPQNEVPEFMSRELAKHGGAFIQAESELGAVNMAYGAADGWPVVVSWQQRPILPSDGRHDGMTRGAGREP